VIPPKADAEFVAAMEEVLDTYENPHDPDYPVLCMDEQPRQLTKETRKPISATRKHPRRVDYEYERAGVVNLFLFCEPKVGWRSVTARPQKTKADWAREVAVLLDTRYAKAKQVTLVCDNYKTHTRGAFYEVFPPNKAREYVKKLRFCYTPVHGSWLNIAENELSCLTRQCLAAERYGSEKVIKNAVRNWSDCKNETQRAVDWQFRTTNARTKLKSLYPRLEL
jgi:hypothetical protein